MIADLHTPGTTDDVALADNASSADMNPGMGQATEIVHVEFSAPHDESPFPDGDSLGASVEIGSLNGFSI